MLDISESYDYSTTEASQLTSKEKGMTCIRIISECIKKTSRLRVILEHGGFVEVKFMVMEVCGGLKPPQFLVKTSKTSIPVRCKFKKIQIEVFTIKDHEFDVFGPQALEFEAFKILRSSSWMPKK